MFLMLRVLMLINACLFLHLPQVLHLLRLSLSLSLSLSLNLSLSLCMGLRPLLDS